MIEDPFSIITKNYKKSVRQIRSFPEEGKETEDYVKKSKKFIEYINDANRVLIVGTGRQEEIADFITRILKASDKNVRCSKDPSYPQEYESDDLIIALSSSGSTKRTIHFTEPAYKGIGSSTPVIGITTNPDSPLGEITEKTGGFTIKIPGKSKKDVNKRYQKRQFLGQHDPLSLSGTSGELYTLEFMLDSIGSAVTKKPVMKYHQELWEKVEDFEPDASKIERMFELLPDMIDYSKGKSNAGKIVIGGLGLSGVISRFFTIRLSHCAKGEKERRVYFYKDKGVTSMKEGDLTLIISGSGQEFWSEAVKNINGNIASITGFPDTSLSKESDLNIQVPGREETYKDPYKVENAPRDPAEALFELRTLFLNENFIYSLVKASDIPIKDIESRHPDLT